MVSRCALALACLAGCHGDGGRHYLLQVTPTVRAQSADTLLVSLQRVDVAEQRSFHVGLRSDLVAPWLLDVQTGAWGAAPIQAVAEAQLGGQPLARGTGSPSGEVIAISLADVTVADDGSVDDLSRPSDLLSLSDPDLQTAPDLLQSADLSCPVVAVQATALADAALVSAQPTLNFGTGPVANISTGLSSVGLFRFNINAVPVGATLLSARLTLSYAKNSEACATGCGSCDSIENPGLLSLFYARSDWVEDQCSWNRASTATVWGAAGAAQADVDRSASSIATVNHQVKQDVVFDLDPASFVSLVKVWRSGDLISFVVSPSNGATFVLATITWDKCMVVGPDPLPPRLEIKYCP